MKAWRGDCKMVSRSPIGLSRAVMPKATTSVVLDNKDRAEPPTCRTYRKDEEPEREPERTDERSTRTPTPSTRSNINQ
jgi:hypothetical protein